MRTLRSIWKNGEHLTRYSWCLIAVCGVLVCGCGESDVLIRKKLEVICASDLKAITADLPKTSIIDTPSYSIVSYKSFNEGMYSKMAIVDFYFLKKVKAKTTRKYRYYASAQLWDRYYNAYFFFSDTVPSLSR